MNAPWPRWLQPHAVLVVALALALAAALAAAVLLRQDARQAETESLQTSALYARLLAEQVDRALDSSRVTLQAMSEALRQEPDPQRRETLLANTTRSLPFLRSLSLVDGLGQVLASSNPQNRNAVLPMHLLGSDPSPGRLGLGTPQRARDLFELGEGGQGPSWLVPLQISLPNRPTPLRMVAALNPDFFANAFEMALQRSQRHAALVQLDRGVLAGTSGSGTGMRLLDHAVFVGALPTRDFGDYRGSGLGGTPALGAYRATRLAPWAVLIEQDESLLEQRQNQRLRRTLALLAALWLCLSLFAGLAWRSLRAHRRARQQAMAAEAIKRELLDQVAQELRAPVQAILQYAQGGAGASLGAIRSEAERLLGRVDSLLALADAAQGHPQHAPRSGLDLRALLRPICTDAQARVEALDIHVHTHADEEALSLNADPGTLGQALQRLIEHALAHCPPGGEVLVSLLRDGDEALLRVRDPGPPLLGDALERGFEAGAAVRAGDSDAGLGLMICRRIVQRHGGSMQAANLPAGGVEISVRLPLELASLVAPIASPQSSTMS